MMFNITPSNYLALWYITNEMSIMDALDYITLHYHYCIATRPLQSNRPVLTTYFIKKG